MEKLVKNTSVLSFILLFSLQAFAGGLECKRIHVPENAPSVSDAALLEAAKTSTIKRLNNLLSRKPGLKKYLNQSVLNQVLEMMASPDQPIYQRRLNEFVDALTKSRSTTHIAAVREALGKVLKPIMRTKDAEKRINAFLAGTASLKQALGEMTAKEGLHAYIGERGIQQIDPDSLVGRYLSEAAKIKGAPIAKTIAAFKVGPNKRTKGESRLVIAVDEATYSLFEKTFMRDQLLIHSHDVQQGTLEMTFNGKRYDWYGGGARVNRPYGEGHMYPPIVLATSEAQRVKLFFDLLSTNEDLARHPWKLGRMNPETNKVERYCAIGAYTSCTQWYGNIPMGDKLVTEYMMPGYVDNYASISLYSNKTKDKAPRVQPLGRYDSEIHRNTQYYDVRGNRYANPRTTENLEPLNLDAATENLVRLVWREGEGHMQLWQVLGLKRQQQEAELANPGYVAYAEIAGTSRDRVPVVFVMSYNATERIDTRSILENIDAH